MRLFIIIIFLILILPLSILSYPDNVSIEDVLLESQSLISSDWQKSNELALDVYDQSKLQKNHLLTAQALFIIAYHEYYHYGNKDGTIDYYTEGLTYAEQSKDQNIQYDFTMEMAKWYYYRAKDYDQSMDYYHKSIELGKSLNDHKKVGRAYAKSASNFLPEKNWTSLVTALDNGKEHFLKGGFNSYASYYYSDVGLKVWEFDKNKAIDLYLKGLEVDPKNYYANMCIGNAYLTIGLPETAIEHLELSLGTLETKQVKYSTCTNHLSEAYFQIGEYEKADSLCNLNIELCNSQSQNFKRNLPEAYRIKGRIQEQKGDNAQALEYYETAFLLSEKSQFSADRCQSNLSLGEYYLEKDYNTARTHCLKAYEIAEKYNYPKYQARACECLHQVYKNEESYNLSLKYLEDKEKIIASLNENTIIQKLQVFEKLNFREKEIAFEQMIKDEQIKSQSITNNTLRFALVIGAVLLALLISSIKRIKKQNIEINEQTDTLLNINEDLKQSNDELERFAYITSHDLKTPMLIIVQFTKLLAEQLTSNNEPIVKDCLEHIEKGGHRMVRLIDGVLEYSKTSNENTNMEVIDLGYLFSEITELTLDNSKKTYLNIDYSSLPMIKWNYTRILLLFKNMIENGLKYNQSESPSVKVYGQQNDNSYSVHIEDNGIGIKEEYFDKIFVMFNRLHNQRAYTGSGLGLATCKKIVDNFGGEILIESTVNKGTKFEIQFPISMTVTKSEERVA